MDDDDAFLRKAFSKVGNCKNCAHYCTCRTQGNDERRSSNVDFKMQTDFTTLMCAREMQDMVTEGRSLDPKIQAKMSSMRREVPDARTVLVDSECRKRSAIEQQETAHRQSVLNEFDKTTSLSQQLSEIQGVRITRGPVQVKTVRPKVVKHDPEQFKNVRLVRPRNPRMS